MGVCSGNDFSDAGYVSCIACPSLFGCVNGRPKPITGLQNTDSSINYGGFIVANYRKIDVINGQYTRTVIKGVGSFATGPSIPCQDGFSCSVYYQQNAAAFDTPFTTQQLVFNFFLVPAVMFVQRVPCPVGYFSNYFNQYQCVICPKGYRCYNYATAIQADKDRNVLFVRLTDPATAGTVLNFNGIIKESCASTSSSNAAQYSNEGATSCTTCPAGSFCNGGLKYSCVDVGNTTWSDAGFAQCQPCPAGSYCVGGIKRNCTLGYYSGGNAGSCLECPEGYECTKGILKQCPSGSYSSHGEVACRPCPSGFYCVNGIKMPCEEGTFSLSDSSECADLCPDGFLCLPSGQIVPCTPGYYCVAGAPVKCPEQTWSFAGASVCADPPITCNVTAGENCKIYCDSECNDPSDCPNSGPASWCSKSLATDCDIGTYCTDISLCPDGYECHDNLAIPCGPGYYSQQGTVTCVPCDPDFFCTGGFEYPCPTGYASGPNATICQTCSEGYFFSETTFSCEACPPGTYGTDDLPLVCQPCLPGFYSSDFAATSCEQCATDYPRVMVAPDFQSTQCVSCPDGQQTGDGVSCVDVKPFVAATVDTAPSQVVADVLRQLNTFKQNAKIFQDKANEAAAAIPPLTDTFAVFGALVAYATTSFDNFDFFRKFLKTAQQIISKIFPPLGNVLLIFVNILQIVGIPWKSVDNILSDIEKFINDNKLIILLTDLGIFLSSHAGLLLSLARGAEDLILMAIQLYTCALEAEEDILGLDDLFLPMRTVLEGLNVGVQIIFQILNVLITFISDLEFKGLVAAVQGFVNFLKGVRSISCISVLNHC